MGLLFGESAHRHEVTVTLCTDSSSSAVHALCTQEEPPSLTGSALRVFRTENILFYFRKIFLSPPKREPRY